MATQIAPESIPLLSTMTLVDDYEDCKKILTSPHQFLAGTFHDASERVWGKIMVASNDDSHLRRRRHVGTLLSRSAVGGLADDEVLGRAITNVLSNCERESPAQDPERFTTDIIELTRLTTVQIAAEVVGLDLVVTSNDDARRILSAIEGFVAAVGMRWMTDASAETQEQIVAHAFALADEYRDTFYLPAARRRQALIDAGEPLPTDFVTRQLLPDGQALWPDTDAAVIESMSFLMGGTQTTGIVLAATLDAYLPWEGRDRSREGDPEWVRSILNETLRLRPPVPYILREVAEDVELPSGRRFTAGERVGLLVEPANRDTTTFGEDAEVFRPDRHHELRGEPQYGLAFGAGPHLCVGRPLVTTGATHERETTVQRVVTRLLSMSLERDVAPDPAHPATKIESYVDAFKTFPVTLRRGGDA